MQNQKHADLSNFRKLYVESMKWWSDRQESGSSHDTVSSTREFVESWLKCLEDLYFQQTNRRPQEAEMQTEFTVAMNRLKSNKTSETEKTLETKPVEVKLGDFTLANWGYFQDLSKLLESANDSPEARIVACQRHEMLSILKGRNVTNSQLTDTYAILKSIVHGLDKSNIESMIDNIQLAMHAINDRSFSVEKVGLLRVLLAIRDGWLHDGAERPRVAAKLLTRLLPLDASTVSKDQATPVRVTWQLSGVETIHDGSYILEIEDSDQPIIRFAPHSQHFGHRARTAALPKKRLWDYIVAEESHANPLENVAQLRLKLRGKIDVNAETETLLDESYVVQFEYPEPHKGLISSGLYGRVHANVAWMLGRTCLWTGLQIIHVVGSNEIAAPHIAVTNALRVECGKMLTMIDCQIRAASELIGGQPAKSLSRGKIHVVFSPDRLDPDKLDAIMRQWLNESSESRLILIESCPLEKLQDLVEERKRQVTESMELIVVDEETQDLDKRSDCMLLIDTALPGVTIDDEAREMMLDCMEPIELWSLKRLILKRVAEALKGKLPYVDRQCFARVWQTLVTDGEIAKSLIKTADAKHNIVLVSLWELFLETNMAQSPGSIMNRVGKLLEDQPPQSSNQALSPKEMEVVLEQLCVMQLCDRQDLFLYSPSSMLRTEHILGIKSMLWDRDGYGQHHR